MSLMSSYVDENPTGCQLVVLLVFDEEEDIGKRLFDGGKVSQVTDWLVAGQVLRRVPECWTKVDCYLQENKTKR